MFTKSEIEPQKLVLLPKVLPGLMKLNFTCRKELFGKLFSKTSATFLDIDKEVSDFWINLPARTSELHSPCPPENFEEFFVEKC